MLIRPKLLLASSTLLAAATVVPALAQVSLPVVNVTPRDLSECTVATSLRGTSDVATCNCQEGSLSGSAWGTDIYTDDSAICAAARHKGVIGTGGGRVNIQAMPGQASYKGSSRNGVNTSDYGSWAGSFRFVSLGSLAVTEGGTCDSVATWRGRASALACSCPANFSMTRSVWGSDTYTDDSYICKAALHAGVIGRSGGRVTVELLGGQQSYKGSSRNGVATSDYGSWGGSYRFIR